MIRRDFLAWLGSCWAARALAQARVTPVEPEDRAEERVGRRYWVRPGLNDTSVDFYAEPELRTRWPVRDKRRLRVVDIMAIDRGGGKQIVYRVRFDDGGEAHIEAGDFDRRLYRELAPNQVMTAPADSPVSATPQIWTFQRSSLFAADPDVIWERIKNEGPRTFTPARQGRKTPGAPAQEKKPHPHRP